ncbi:MAG: translation elongation factor Ts [Planctomycetota bacterium]|nr:translation elongation factor Ts [Planctomycetota bacterium]
MSAITAQAVSSLRTKTGASMMECKHALTEAAGDEQKAVDILRQKGLKSAEKRADRSTSQGRVYSYIHHNGRVGVMVQLGCETDFVARGEEFEALCRDLCMHIAAASPVPVAVNASDIPAELVNEERRVLLGSQDLAGKPENIREKIVSGRLEKFVQERALLEQEDVRDPSIKVGERVKALSGRLGENIKVERFARFELGA